MTLRTEPIGSIPRPPELIEGMKGFASGNLSADRMESLLDSALRATIPRLEEAGSPV